MRADDVNEGGSEERYRLLLDTAPDAIVVVGEGATIELVNAQAETLFGYAREELLGQPLDMLVPERFRATHAGHVGRFFGASARRPMGSGLELFGRRKDGTEIPIEVSLSPVRAGGRASVSAAIRDITERRRVEAAARLAAERLASAVESIQDAIALFDDADRLVQCNSAYRSLLGKAVQGPLVGKPFAEILDAWLASLAFAGEDERARFRTERLAERREPRRAFDVRSTDGHSFRVADRRTVEGGIVQTIWDLTDDVRREEELREARRAAEEASGAKSEFLSSMSHELRTPMNAILGFAQLLRRDKKEPPTGRQRERVEQILKGGEHLLRLIEEVLHLSRIEAGRVSISVEPVTLADVLDEVRTTLEPLASGASIRVEVPGPAADAVQADRTRLAQILMNFCSNAIKYNRPGGSVTFLVSRPQPERVRITIADTGIGIPEDKQPKLFQPFQRAGQELGSIEGTGIGLTISKRLAELMGGSVGFRSTPGEGSAFWVEMPAHDVAARPAPIASAREERAPHAAIEARSTVLYVEDNPANVAFMRDLLGTFEQLDVVIAPTAEMGIELARERRPRAIIMDINLPGMSGLEALQALRRMPETSHIPVIALTAAASERDRKRGEQAGFYRYLTKPVKVDELEAALEPLLSPAG